MTPKNIAKTPTEVVDSVVEMRPNSKTGKPEIWLYGERLQADSPLTTRYLLRKLAIDAWSASVDSFAEDIRRRWTTLGVRGATQWRNDGADGA